MGFYVWSNFPENDHSFSIYSKNANDNKGQNIFKRYHDEE